MGETYTVQEAAITDETRWNLLQKKARDMRAVSAFTLFRENGIEPILIKGLAAAQFYPEPSSRDSVDMDLAVSADDFAAASVISKTEAANRLNIDLHCELRHLDTVEWHDLFKNSRLMEVEDAEIRILRPEDHLRVLCVHWLNDGGAYKEKLWDIYYAVKNRPPDFDWKRCLDPVNHTRRRWIAYTLGLAHHYLDLNLDDTPIREEAYNLPQWIIREIEREWASGVPLLPLHVILQNRTMLFKQIRKRLRPNPIQATIDMEGSFDAKTRVFYQIGSIFKRIIPSFRRISNRIMSRDT